MLQAPQSAAAVAGATPAAVAALSIAEASEDVDDLLGMGAEARVSVAEVVAANLVDEAVGAECERRLRRFFADDNADVRKAASMCWNYLEPDQITARGSPISAFAQVMRREDDLFFLVHGLKESLSRLPAEVCDLAEHAVTTFRDCATSIRIA